MRDMVSVGATTYEHLINFFLLRSGGLVTTLGSPNVSSTQYSRHYGGIHAKAIWPLVVNCLLDEPETQGGEGKALL